MTTQIKTSLKIGTISALALLFTTACGESVKESAKDYVEDKTKAEINRTANRTADKAKDQLNDLKDKAKKEAERAKNKLTGTGSNISCDQASQQAMLDAVNQVRSQGRYCGNTFKPAVAPLVWNANLAKAAADHAKDMADNNYFSHTSQDGRRFSTRARQAGYNSSYLGENIAAGRAKIDGAIEQWITSTEGHCENMMNADYQDLGMACAKNSGSEYGTYWVQVLGRK